jgi:hypothetical protein
MHDVKQIDRKEGQGHSEGKPVQRADTGVLISLARNRAQAFDIRLKQPGMPLESRVFDLAGHLGTVIYQRVLRMNQIVLAGTQEKVWTRSLAAKMTVRLVILLNK